jgi:glucose/arabinose dehydrogenase
VANQDALVWRLCWLAWKLKPHAALRLQSHYQNGEPVGDPIEFATGFLTEGGKAHGRPVGVTLDPRGALIVADDLSNTVWRIAVTDEAAASN